MRPYYDGASLTYYLVLIIVDIMKTRVRRRQKKSILC